VVLARRNHYAAACIATKTCCIADFEIGMALGFSQLTTLAKRLDGLSRSSGTHHSRL
jgi:hypothetical protein